MNVDAWIDGAKRTHRSVKIYSRPDLIAKLDDLSRDMAVWANDPGKQTELEAEFVAVGEQFHDSGVVFTCKGLTRPEQEAIYAQAALEHIDRNTDEGAAQISARLLAASLVDPVMTVEQLFRLQSAIGEPQMGAIVAAYELASVDKPPAVQIPGVTAEPDDG